MFKAIMKFIEDRAPANNFTPEEEEHRRKVAVAVLLIEAAYIDRECLDSEKAHVKELVRSHFGLSQEEANDIIAEAERREKETYEDWIFTQAVKKGYDAAGRKEIVGLLWDVAYSDGALHRFEEYMIGRIAKELELSDADMEAARKAAAERRAA